MLLENGTESWAELAALGRQIGGKDPDAVLSAVVDIVILHGFECASTCMLDDLAGSYFISHARGVPENYARETHLANGGLCGRVLQNEGTQVMTDYTQAKDAVPVFAKMGMQTVIGTPLWVEGKLRGVLVAGTERRHEMVGTEEIIALEFLAAHASRALETAEFVMRERQITARLRALLEGSPDALVVVDPGGLIVEVSKEAERLFDYESGSLIGKPIEILVPVRLRETHEADSDAFLLHPTSRCMGADLQRPLYGRRSDGFEFLVEISLKPVTTPDGLLVSAAVRDMTESNRVEALLKHQTTHDALTGLPDRSLFLENLDAAITSSRLGQPPMVLFLIDLDHFKNVNDKWGHGSGDALLIEVAERLSDIMKPYDVLARFGDDEFVVVANGLRETSDISDFGTQLLSVFVAPFVCGNSEFPLFASIGVARAAPGNDTETLLRNTDMAMYRAKQKNRTRKLEFDDGPGAHAAERVKRVSDLHDTLEQNEFQLLK